MLEGDSTRGFVARCDQCGAQSGILTLLRALAVLKLMKASWHVTTDGATLCPDCVPPSTRMP
jgi:hypothetical protein